MFLLGIWLYPAIITGVLLLVWSYYVTMRVAKETEQQATTEDTPIHEAIKDHPFLLNPIIVMYFIMNLFLGIIIFYYWATTSY